MADVCFRVRDAIRDQQPTMPGGLRSGSYVVSTIHRAENTDNANRLSSIIDTLAQLPVTVLLLAHPRLVTRCHEFGIPLDRPSTALHAAEPLSYPQMVATVLHSAGVVTDSGGLQKEAFLLGRPCTTLRNETEWVETLIDGWNVLAPDLDGVADLAARPAPTGPQEAPYGDGKAAEAVVAELAAATRR
jgi:UDP-N-acetylglucosamine 2-epimerase (non-hydrolysing)